MREKGVRLSMVAAVFALLSIATLASAHGGNNDPNVVHACIGNVSHIVRIVGVTGSCREAETPAHWDIQGPPGINGTNGTSVTITGTLLKGDAHCSNGGVSLTDGTGTFYLCNGVDGTNGTGGTRADGPCFNNFNRYVNCGNGTVTDTVTGLIWLKHADCNPLANYPDANRWAAGLKDGDCSGNLTDKSSPGDWRLPTKDEWSAMIARAVGLGCTESANPSLTNDAGTACLSVGPSSFVGVASFFYWSSTTSETFPTGAWFADVIRGFVYTSPIKGADTFFAWPVRGGSR